MSISSGSAVSCPLNITFYACDFGVRFLGCCENGSPADTCNHGCPQEDLLPASFEKEYYNSITQAACTSGDWWSCANTSPPFLGCCLSNPCVGGCPLSDLTAAIFSQNQTENPLYSAISNITSAAASTTLSPISTAASSTPLGTTGAASPAITNQSPTHESSTRKVVGGVVGGIVALGGIGVLLLYRHLKSRAYKGSDSTGTHEKGDIQDIVTRSPPVSKISRQENDASHGPSTIVANPGEESRMPSPSPQSTTLAPYIKDRTQLEIHSATSGSPREVHEEDKALQELPPNQAPLPEIASSDSPQSYHELPSSDAPIQEHIHPRALQPGRPGFRPYSASTLVQAAQPYGLGFRPHSPSGLSMVSSFDSPSPVSVTKGDISADV